MIPFRHYLWLVVGYFIFQSQGLLSQTVSEPQQGVRAPQRVFPDSEFLDEPVDSLNRIAPVLLISL